MNSKQTKHFKTSHRRMAVVYKADFHFTVDEWLAFWEAQPLMAERCIDARGVIVVRRDSGLPWTPDNIVVSRAKRKQAARRGAPAGPRQDAYPDSRTLSVNEWISELRQ